MPTTTLRNAQLHYLDRGSGTPIVLLHGFPVDSRMWESQLEALSDRWRVIAPDLPGFGRSALSGPFTIASLADDVHALLQQLGALPCVLGGLSMGGYIAMALAKRCPADLLGLVLMDTRAEGDAAAARENRDKTIQLVRQKGSAAVAEQMFPKLLSEQTIRSQPQIAAKLRQMMDSQAPKAIEHATAALRDREDRTADLPSIAVPTLIIVGEHDAITPPDVARKMEELIPNSTLAIISAAGHMSPMEQPDDVNAALRRFAESIEDQQGGE